MRFQWTDGHKRKEQHETCMSRRSYRVSYGESQASPNKYRYRDQYHSLTRYRLSSDNHQQLYYY
jgi:hypothetical protein